ncbi:hypothetical protein TeGR_g2617 [Tetraparma gracilis]|uniref:Uncharacterized protein n=1 Tax=Tetraparma gracilis TaxID=2962635 RepID=A0ABQ6MJV6_9STRA|nr:hypothetical protein TeGR_g2617 [Tetraparma gracilis]
MGSSQGGLSERIASFLIHDEITTFKDLRQMIEVVNDNGMNRRTAVFQDLLFLMEHSSNPHKYPRKELLHYRFGIIEGVGGQELGDTNVVRDYDRSLAPILIKEEVEDEPIREIVANLLELDLLLVPVSQIRPSDDCVTLRLQVQDIVTEEEKMKRDLELINSIDLSKYSPEKIAEANRPSPEKRAQEEEEEAMAMAENA